MNDVEKIRILLIEDDEILAKELQRYLTRWNYQVVIAKQFEEITGEVFSCSPHLILLDINLPYYDGFYWCRKIREVSEVPILFISSRGGDAEQIMAMAQGGDDYVEKPFRLELFRAKLDAILRRTYQYRCNERLCLSNELMYDAASQSVFAGTEKVELTKTETKILSKLLEKRGNVVTRDELMMELWSTDEYVSDGTLTTLVSRLRAKLKAYGEEEVIRTKIGMGYLIE